MTLIWQALYAQTSSVLWGRASESERLQVVEAFGANTRVLQVTPLATVNCERVWRMFRWRTRVLYWSYLLHVGFVT